MVGHALTFCPAGPDGERTTYVYNFNAGRYDCINQFPVNSSGCLSNDGSGNYSWVSCGGGGGSSSLQVTQGGVQITSPTVSINFNASQFSLAAVGSTSTISLNLSSVTAQGNNLSATYLTNSSATATYFPNVIASSAVPFGSAVNKITTDVSNFNWDDTNHKLSINSYDSETTPLGLYSFNGSGEQLFLKNGFQLADYIGFYGHSNLGTKQWRFGIGAGLNSQNFSLYDYGNSYSVIDISNGGEFTTDHGEMGINENFGFYDFGPIAQMDVNSSDAQLISLLARGASGQTSDIQEWKSAFTGGADTLAGVTANGAIYTTSSMTVTGAGGITVTYGVKAATAQITGLGTNTNVCTDGSSNLTTSGCSNGTLTSAYTTVDNSGSALTQRATLNFTGTGVTCVDNSGSSRTDCTITSGGGGGSSSLAVALASTTSWKNQVSSPTAAIAMDQSQFYGTLVGSSTGFLSIAYSSNSISGSYTTRSTDSFIVANCASACTITLSTTSIYSSGKVFGIEQQGAGNVTLSPAAGTISGQSNIIMIGYASYANGYPELDVWWDGTNWHLK